MAFVGTSGAIKKGGIGFQSVNEYSGISFKEFVALFLKFIALKAENLFLESKIFFIERRIGFRLRLDKFFASKPFPKLFPNSENGG